MTGKAGKWAAVVMGGWLSTAPIYAAAMPAPFIWPESYQVTITEKMRGGSKLPSVVVVTVDGMSTRRQILLPTEKAHVEIYRIADRKKIVITPTGQVSQSQLPEDWPARDPIFPASNNWEMVTKEDIGDQSAIRYKVNRDDEQIHESAIPKEPYALVWFSSDNRMPLRMIDGNRIVEFSNYVPGPQDPALFEANAKAAQPIAQPASQPQAVATPMPTPATPEMTPVAPSASSTRLMILPAPKVKVQ